MPVKIRILQTTNYNPSNRYISYFCSQLQRMPEPYSQIKAMLAITKASLIATFKSPQAVFFSLFFPIVLIMIFGTLAGRGGNSVSVAFAKGVDSANVLYASMKNMPVLHFVDPAKRDIEDELKKGRITAIIDIRHKGDSAAPYEVHLSTSSASVSSLPILQSVMRDLIHTIDQQLYADQPTYAKITQSVVPGRAYKMIDFLLPGLIGFSLIGSAIFGVAFLFYSLRETMVLKRLYSTPIKRVYIILGEGLSKVLFQLLTVVVIVSFGYFIYGFTLAHGWITFLDMLLISFLALLVFLGFGFLISAISKHQNVIPIYSNLFMFPQYFLSGTFFPKTSLPDSIQSIINLLPLTALNDALRNIAFEGAYLTSCWPQILILLAWGLLVYLVTVKVFRWE